MNFAFSHFFLGWFERHRYCITCFLEVGSANFYTLEWLLQTSGSFPQFVTYHMHVYVYRLFRVVMHEFMLRFWYSTTVSPSNSFLVFFYYLCLNIFVKSVLHVPCWVSAFSVTYKIEKKMDFHLKHVCFDWVLLVPLINSFRILQE